MSPPDRDRSFEQALARNFASAARHSAGPPCPDPETVAAYHENALAPQELLSWQQHFAACSRCQELLKHLEATDNIVLQPLGTGKAAALGAPVTEARRSRLGLSWASSWRWAVPAGALAAGLLLWVVVRPTQSPTVEMAKNQPSAPLTPPAQEPRAANTSPAPQKPVESAPPSSREADRASAEGSSKMSDRLSAADAAKTSAKGAPGEIRLGEANAQRMVPPGRATDGREQNAAAAHARKEPEAAANSFYRDSAEHPVVKPRAVERGDADLKKEAADLSVAAPAVPKTTAQSLTAPSETTSAERREGKALGAVAGTLSEEMEEFQSARSPNGRVGFLKTSAPSPATILAPDGRVQWRVGMAGRIELSADAGRSWVAQTSAVAADFLAGFAVSDQICWIVGRAGTILRTTDGGAHWLKLPSPSPHDLAAVRATDAQQAVIVDAANRRAYKTTDGGASWTVLSAE